MERIVVGSRVRLRGTDIIGYVLSIQLADNASDRMYVLWEDQRGTKRSSRIEDLCLYGEQSQPKRMYMTSYIGRSEVEAAAMEKYLLEQMVNRKPIKGLGITMMIHVMTKKFELETGNHTVSFIGVVVEGSDKINIGQVSTSFEIVDKPCVTSGLDDSVVYAFDKDVKKGEL